jgi:hypothetical protein
VCAAGGGPDEPGHDGFEMTVVGVSVVGSRSSGHGRRVTVVGLRSSGHCRRVTGVGSRSRGHGRGVCVTVVPRQAG